MSVQGPSFDEVVAASVSRRHVMAGGTAALAAFLGLSAPAPASAAARPEPKAEASGRLGFAAVPASTADTVTVPAGHSVQTLAPWGQPVRGHSPRWRADGGSGAAEQALQIGTHHSGVHFFPYDDGVHVQVRGYPEEGGLSTPPPGRSGSASPGTRGPVPSPG
ncbi:alkaline phosphatase PhoX [Streptomyces sp. NPDC059468]|uniref:alkaline phosphatase PhoX n=1 Tax=Streptomyces sp. NPDC059468 TaxID=3346845 RepID=UPI0036763175